MNLTARQSEILSFIRDYAEERGGIPSVREIMGWFGFSSPATVAGHLDLQLSGMSRLTNIDFSQFDLDEPLPPLTTNGHQSTLAKWIGKTPRSLASGLTSRQGVDFVGTADHVAGVMQEIMQEVGGDGFLLFNATFDRRYIMEVCDGLVPELQRRGLVRGQYAHKHLRDNLLEF